MSTSGQRLVAALDLGSTRIAAAIGEVTGDPRHPGVRVLGVGSERTTGIRRGVVRDIEETTRAIGRALKDAQLMAGVEVGTVYAGIAGEHVAGRLSHGVVSVTGNEIRTADVARVNEVAANVAFSRDHELLHAVPQDYLVDGQAGISDPIGMIGSRLEAQVYLVTVLSSAVVNLQKCIEKAGFRVGEFVLEPLAGSLAALTPDERELGCALIELGGGSTNVAVFQQGKICHTASLMFAGNHVTNDLVHGLQVPQQDAEKLKERHGAAYEPSVSNDEVIELPAGPGQPSRPAHRRVLAHIMHMRMQEILELALDELNRTGFRQRLAAGVVLSGGGAQVPGIVELTREVFALPVRIAQPGTGLSGLVDRIAAPRMTVPAGLLLYGAKQVLQSGGFGVAARRSPAVEKVIGPVKRWLQDFF
ncbi:MAG: cell division protein FtsA [Gemmatimonadales bacterium]|nr:cell division protein FtsA [Gemmatimonadales bacterium]